MSAPAQGRPTARLLLVAMILAIGLGPRIRVPGLLDRAFDLRVQDLLLIPVLLYLGSRAPSLRPVWGRWPLWFAVGAVGVTSVRLLLDPTLSLLRTVSYLGRGLEPLLLAVAVAGLYRLAGDGAGRLALRALHATVLANIAWVAYQAATGSSRTLLGSSVGELLASYGPKLVGEGSAFGTGVFFAFVTALGCAHWLTSSASRGLAMALIGAGVLGAYLAESRVSLAAAVVCLLLTAFIPVGGHKRSVTGGLGLAAVGAGLYAWNPEVPQAGRLSSGGLDNSLNVRVQDIWEPLIHAWWSEPLFGIGPGQLGTPKYPWVEAHNVVLRALLDYGLVVALLFFATLATILIRAHRAATSPETPAVTQLWATLAGLTLVAVLVTGVAQESLTAVMSTHLVMLAVGLYAGAVLGPAPDRPRPVSVAEMRAEAARRSTASV